MSSIQNLMWDANPIPDPGSEFSDDEIGALLLLTRTRSTGMGMTETLRPTEPEKERNRRGWFAAGVSFAAIIAMVGGGLWFASMGDTGDDASSLVTTTIEATTTTAATVAGIEASQAAISFLTATETFDVDAALALLADDAVIALGPADSKSAVAKEMRWQEATGLVVTPQECSVADATQPSEGSIAVGCTATVASPIAAVGGAEPIVFTYEATVDDGVITAIESVDLGIYSNAVWVPFESWVRTSRSDAHPIMFSSAGTGVVLSDESIELWRQYTTEYVNEKTFDDAFANSEAYLEARYEGDVERAVSFLAPTAVLDWGPGTSPEELATALVWENAVGISFEPLTCVVLSGSRGDTGEVVNVRCSMFATSAISEAIGDPGGVECVSILVDGGVIQSAVMGDYRGPACEGFNFAGRVFGPFTAWLEDVHPELSFVDLYNQRSDGADIERWRVLTEEFVAAQQG